MEDELRRLRRVRLVVYFICGGVLGAYAVGLVLGRAATGRCF
jgi:hypothetical protein